MNHIVIIEIWDKSSLKFKGKGFNFKSADQAADNVILMIMMIMY